MATKITDLVDQETIDKIKELNNELQNLLETYTNTAKDLAKGVDVNVKVVGDIDKLEKLLTTKSLEAATATERLNEVMGEQSRVIANTTNTISRQLMIQERVNKTQRESYTEHERVKNLLEQYHDTYEGQLESLNRLNIQLSVNKKAQAENKKALESGRISITQYNAAQVELIAQHRALTQAKRSLTQIMTAEEKAAQSQDGSYVQMSQHLELLKKAYKDLSDTGRDSAFGKEMESAIQNLDAHLKDVAADMGEFQRNVGNYAIAGQNGVVSTESLMAALQQQAITTKDLSDQSKILLEARSMLNTEDENYARTVERINEKIAENSRKLSDVSDIMNVQVTTIADAETQNQRLAEALKFVDQSSEDAAKTIAAINAKIAENNKVIAAGTGERESVKKGLKELVLEIANLSIEYQNLTEEEKKSASGQELAAHIAELTEKAGVLKDAIADTNQAITNAASDTRGFDQLSGSLQLAINGFGLATGAAEMLGISEGELAEIQTKLQAAIAASNSMSKIQTALQKQSALMQAANTIQTKLRTTAENIHTTAQGRGIVVTKAATVAQWGFNAAASANPIGLVVVGITACIAAVWGLCKAFKAFTGPSKSALKEYDAHISKLDSLKNHNQDMIETLEAAGRKQETISKVKIESLQKEYNASKELYDFAVKKHLGEEKIAEAKERMIAAEEDLYKEFTSTYFGLTKLIAEEQNEDYRRRKGSAALKKKLLDEEINGQKELIETLRDTAKLMGWNVKQYDDMLAALEKRRSRLSKDIDKEASEEAKRVAENARKAAEELKNAVREGEDALLKIIDDSLVRQRKAEELSYERQLNDLEDQLSKLGKNETQKRQSIYNQIQGLTAEHARKMEEIDRSIAERSLTARLDLANSRLGIVKKGSTDELNIRLEILDVERDKELLQLKKKEADKTITTEEAEELRYNILKKYAKLRQEVEEDHAAHVAESIEKRYADEQSDLDNAHLSALNSLKKRYAEELAAAKDNVEKQEAIKAKFEADSAALTEQYALQTARKSIEMLERILATEDLSAEERLEAEKRLAEAKIQLETEIADATIRQIEATTQKDNEATAKKIENAQRWLNVAGNAVSNIGSLVNAVYDGKIQKIGEEQDANDAAAEKDLERISRLIENQVITQEEGEARKRAAEDKSAKKTEELEKKKAKLKQKQAIWDKANSITQAGIATALAITQSLPNLILAAIVGAMGAVQVATILATPIPKYAKGTDSHKGGPAIVGDGGRHEVIVYNGGAWLTPDKPTLIDMPAGASVIPSVNEYNGITPVISLPIASCNSHSTPPYDDTNMRRMVSELAGLIKAQTKQQHNDSYLTNYELFKRLI